MAAKSTWFIVISLGLTSSCLETPALLQVETIFRDSLVGKVLFVPHGWCQLFLENNNRLSWDINIALPNHRIFQTDTLRSCRVCLHIQLLDGTFGRLPTKRTPTIKSACIFSINELRTFNCWGPHVFIELLITIDLALWVEPSLVSLGHPLGLYEPGPGLYSRLMTWYWEFNCYFLSLE